MRIAIFGNIFRPVILSHIQVLFDYFKGKKATILLDKVLYEFVFQHGLMNPEGIEIIQNDDFVADLALSIGGDGTFLNTAARIGRKQIPILGINTGRLGFLADVSNEDIIPALDAILANYYSIEERSLLFVESSDGTVYESRNRATLCRCGKSLNKPYCDGTHIMAGFNDGDESLKR